MNAIANNQLIIEQARNRSEEKGNERLEAQRAAQAQLDNYQKLDNDRQIFLQRINRLNEKILEEDKKGTHNVIHSVQEKQKDMDQHRKVENEV